MPDHTEIACIIAEWWHHQKEKKHLLESTITLEQFLQIDKLEPLEIVEEKVQLVLKKPGGRRKVIWKNKNGSRKIVQMHQGIPILTNESEVLERIMLRIRKKLKGCNTCPSEIYYQSEQEDGLTYNRDCLCAEAQDYFNRKCALKFSRSEIPPVTNCRCWEKVKEKSVV